MVDRERELSSSTREWKSLYSIRHVRILIMFFTFVCMRWLRKKRLRCCSEIRDNEVGFDFNILLQRMNNVLMSLIALRD